MKTLILLSMVAVLTGCAFDTSSEIKRAEAIIQHFECSNIDTEQLSHNSITGFHERTLAVSKDKSIEYIDRYKSGDTLFDMPLYEIIQMQYVSYKSACDFLGGVSVPVNKLNTP